METDSPLRGVVTAGWLLAAAALAGAGMLSMVHAHTTRMIVDNERQDLLSSLNAVIPAQTYDNDILQDTEVLAAHDLLGTAEPSTVYRARKAGVPVAAALTAVAPNGYSGPIAMLVGIDYGGRITGVRVVKHRETPGLGDGIDARHGSWIEGFDHKSLLDPQDAGWKVKRDGGEFDQLTGATISPRAVVGAVHKALQYFQQHRTEIFTPMESRYPEDPQ
jgi:electron transport complex protein RnfG